VKDKEAIMNRLLGAALGLLCLGSAAIAQETEQKTLVAVGLICDTAQQVGRYVNLYTEGASAETAMQVVNKEENNPRACRMTAAVFIVGEAVETISLSGGDVQIVEITMVAAQTKTGWRPMAPTVQYTAVFVEAQRA